jgi:hypothetical protein
MAKTKSRASGRSASRKAPRVTGKQKKVSWLAKGYPVLSSVTVLDDCARAIDWYRKVLGARQRLRLDMPGGMVAHCELGFDDSVLMMGSPVPPQFPPGVSQESRLRRLQDAAPVRLGGFLFSAKSGDGIQTCGAARGNEHRRDREHQEKHRDRCGNQRIRFAHSE